MANPKILLTLCPSLLLTALENQMLINSLSPFRFPCHCRWFKLNLFHINSQHCVENKTDGTHNKQKQLTSIHCCYKTYTHGIPSPIFCSFFSASPPHPPKKSNQNQISLGLQTKRHWQHRHSQHTAVPQRKRRWSCRCSPRGETRGSAVGSHAGSCPRPPQTGKTPWNTHTHFFFSFLEVPRHHHLQVDWGTSQCTVYVYLNALCMRTPI